MDELKLDKETIKVCYVYSMVFVIVFDYDKYYTTLYKNALKYGMSSNDFWKGNTEDYFVYEEAYYERMHETQHIGGLYNYMAICSALGNKDSSGKQMSYPQENYYFAQQKQEKANSKKVSNLCKFKEIKKKDLHRRQMAELAHCY